jgi:hypothetical protein
MQLGQLPIRAMKFQACVPVNGLQGDPDKPVAKGLLKDTEWERSENGRLTTHDPENFVQVC